MIIFFCILNAVFTLRLYICIYLQVRMCFSEVGQKNGLNNEVTILTRVSLQGDLWSFFRAAKKSGRNNEVTVLPRWP